MDALRCLPGVGPKTAQRMAFQLLARHRDNARRLSYVLHEAMEKINHCQRCRLFSETDLCKICASTHRDAALLCIVENPIDVMAIEQTASFKGFYFVLMGHLSPLDGIGPEHLGIPQLQEQLKQNTIQEIILATNPTVEGEATAHYISELVKPYKIKTSRIAHGVPLGGELEYIDSSTLARALIGREVL